MAVIDFEAGHEPTAGELDALPKGILDRARRITSSTTTTTETGVLRLDDVPILAGRAYWVPVSNVALLSSVANDDIEARIRFTVDGSTPTTASNILPGSSVRERVSNTAASPIHAINSFYFPTADETLSLLLTIARTAGTGNASIFGAATFAIDMSVVDLGIDPTDHGVDV